LVFAPLLLMMFLMGLYPGPFLSRMGPTVDAYLNRLRDKMALTATAELRDHQRQLSGFVRPAAISSPASIDPVPATRLEKPS
jgi:hypothetical protein